jgi:hypothetical protein
MDQKCPKCKLINPPEAMWCDCGYEFATAKILDRGTRLEKGQYPQATYENPTADKALKYALIGLVCFGVILEPIAIHRALKAKREIAADPSQTGEGKANAALAIAIAGLSLWLLLLAIRLALIR